MSNRDAQTESILASENVDWEFVEGVHISRLDADPDNSQVRVDVELDEDNVRGMIGTLEQGRDLPPIVVRQREDGSFVVVDGHHRCDGVQRADIPESEKRLDVYVIQPSSDRQLDLLSMRFNVESNGIPLSRHERISMAVERHRKHGVPLSRLSDRVNVPARTIGNYVHRQRVKDSLQSKGDFSTHELRQMRESDFDKLHRVSNPIIRAEVARIIYEADLAVQDVVEFVADVSDADTDDERDEIVESWREDTRAAQDDETNSDPVPSRYTRRLNQIESLLDDFGVDLGVLPSNRRNRLARQTRKVAHLLQEQANELEVDNGDW